MNLIDENALISTGVLVENQVRGFRCVGNLMVSGRYGPGGPA
jgi:hypothetical protein